MEYIFLINKKSIQNFLLQFKKHLHVAKCQVKEIYSKKIFNLKLRHSNTIKKYRYVNFL